MVSHEYRQKHPHLEKFWPYVDAINDESPRGKVLVAGGFLEEHLKEILLAFFADCPQSAALLDGGNTPLGTFGARITACYALGLITKNEHDDLQLVRRIRNDFAHDLRATFKRAAIANRCRELKHKAADDEDGPLPTESQFYTAAIALILNLLQRPYGVSKQKRQVGTWKHHNVFP